MEADDQQTYLKDLKKRIRKAFCTNFQDERDENLIELVNRLDLNKDSLIFEEKHDEQGMAPEIITLIPYLLASKNNKIIDNLPRRYYTFMFLNPISPEFSKFLHILKKINEKERKSILFRFLTEAVLNRNSNKCVVFLPLIPSDQVFYIITSYIDPTNGEWLGEKPDNTRVIAIIISKAKDADESFKNVIMDCFPGFFLPYGSQGRDMLTFEEALKAHMIYSEKMKQSVLENLQYSLSVLFK